MRDRAAALDNRAGFDIFKKGGGEALARDVKVPFLGRIPIDSRISETSDSGIPFVIKYADSKTGQIFNEIAKKVIQSVN